MSKTNLKPMSVCVLILAAALLADGAARAATIDWKATSGDSVWGTGTNWVNDIAPADSLTQDIAQFNQTSYAFQPDVSAVARSINGIIIGGNSAAVTITSGTTGNGLTIGDAGIDMSAATNNLTLGASTNKFTLGADQIWSVNTGRTLSVGLLSGGNNLAVTGGGQVTLSNNGNTFGGVGKTITVQGGSTLKAVSSGTNIPVFGSTSSTIVLNGGTITMSPGNDPGGAFTSALTLNSGGANIVNIAGTASNRGVSMSGLVTGNGGFTFNNTSTATILALTNTANTVSGTVGVVGGGTLFVVGDNSADALGTATLSLGGGNAIFTGTTGGATTINFSRATTLTAASSLGAGAGYTLNHTGTLTGSNTLSINTTQTGQFTNGTLAAKNINPGATSTVVLGGDLSGFSGGLTVNNASTLRFGTGATAPLTKIGLITMSAGSTFDMGGKTLIASGLATGGAATALQGIGTGAGGSSALTLDTTGTDRSFAGQIVDSASGAHTLSLVKTGTNTQTLTGASTYTGTTALLRGGLTISGSGTLSNTSAVTVSGGGTLTLSNAAGALVDAAAITLGGSTGGGTLAVTANETVGQIVLGAGLNAVNTSASVTTTIASLGSRATGGVLNFATTGTNTFTTAPGTTNGLIGGWATFGGNTYASLSGSTVVANTTNETLVSLNTDPNGANWISTNNIVFDGVATTNLSSNVTVNSLRTTLANNSTLMTINSGSTLTIATGGLIGGGGTNVRSINGAGDLATGSNELFVSGGNFGINARLLLGTSGVVSVAPSGTLTLSNAGNTLGDIYLNGSGAILQSNANGATGANNSNTIHLLGGTLSTSTTAQVISKALDVGTIGGSIGGGGTFTSTYSGLVTLNGNLNIAPTSNNNNIIRLSNSISGVGAITESTASANNVFMFLELTGNNGYTGGTTLSQATSAGGALVLRIGNNNALGTGTLTVGNGAKGIRIDPVSGSGALVIANAVTSSVNHAVNYAFAFQSGSLSDNLTFTGPVTIGTGIGASIIDTVNSTTQVTFSGAISGTSGLNKIRPGVLQLSGPSTYTGTTTIYDGTLLIGGNAPVSANGALGNSGTAVIVGSNTALPGAYTGSDTVTGLTGTNRITETTDNLAVLTNATVTVGRDFTINSFNPSGTITLGGNTADTSSFIGAISLGRDVILTAPTSASVTFAGVISGSGSGITKTGNGLVTISGANSFSGVTAVSNGTLNVLNTNASSGVTVASGAVLRGNNGVFSAGGLTVTGTVFPGDQTAPNTAAPSDTTNSLTTGPKGTLSATTADFGTNGGKLTTRVYSTGPSGSVTADKLTLSASTGTPLTLAGTSTLELHIQNPSPANYTSNQDAWIVDNSAGTNLNTTPFKNVTVTTGSVSNISVVYLNAANVVQYTQTIPTSNDPTTTIPGYNRIVVRFSGNVTPVKIADFSVNAEGFGVSVTWTAVSEFQNAGFNLYRRDLGASHWSKVNPALISGRITNPDEKKYSYYDWTQPCMFEYKLESVSIADEAESFYPEAGAVTVDWAIGLNAACDISAECIAGIENSFALRASVTKANEAVIAFRAVESAAVPVKAASVREVSARKVEAPAAAPGVALKLAASATVASRWFSSAPISGGSSFTAAKVLYKNAGVLLIPQASMPAGFDLKHAALQREGRILNALALTDSGLLVFAPGYKDDYTDKDAIFIRKASAGTNAGIAAKATGLFSSLMQVNVTSIDSATSEYHDVYFDYSSSLRPFNFTPWFSSKYLTQGTSQDFTINLPQASSSPARLTVNLWSVTSSESVSPNHGLQVWVNGQTVGQAVWNGGGKMLQLTFDIQAGILKPGINSVSLVTPAIDGLTTQISFLHSFSADYTRLLDGSKPLQINNTSGISQLFELDNVPSTGAWVVDARFAEHASLVPTETVVQADGTMKLRFIAAAGGAGRFVVTPVGQENQPLSISKRQVKALKLNGSYLATGPSQFTAGVQPLLAKRSKEGIRGAYVDQEQLFDYYNYGRYGPNGIRNAVRSVQPSYLLLVGRTTYDYLNYEGQNIDPLCPAFLVSTSFWAQTTSDSMFGDFGRGYPEVAVGRLPVNNALELSGTVDHILSYKGPQSSGVRLHAVADRDDPLAGNFGAQADGILADNPELTWQKNYLGTTYQSSAEVTAAMTAAANGGADWLLYSGHVNAARLGASAPNILDQSSVQAWTGNTIFLQSTCTANWMAKNVEDYKSIAIQALTQPQGGISAGIGTSTYMNSDHAVKFMSQLLRNATSGRNLRWGDALKQTQAWAFKQNGGAAGYYTDLSRTEQLFGDPAMPVFSKPTVQPVGAASGSPSGSF